MRRSSCVPGLCTPGVSTKTICAAGRLPFPAGTSSTPVMRFRVVCGLLVTIATFSPTSAFSSVLLPALGRPKIDTNPERNPLLHFYSANSIRAQARSHFFLPIFRGSFQTRGQIITMIETNPDLLHPPVRRSNHLNPQRAHLHHFPSMRNAPFRLAHQPANSLRLVNFFFRLPI